MRAYLAAFRGRGRSVLQYRAAALGGIFTQIFFGLFLAMIMEGWYGSDPGISDLPISLAQAATYIWLGQIMFVLVPWRGDPELQNLVRSGGVAQDLLRPMHIYGLWFARSLAWRLASLVLRCLPILVFSGWLLPRIGLASIALQPPASTGGLLAFLSLLFGAALLSSAITVLISCFQFKQVSALGMNAMAAALISFFSGQIIPLPLIAGPVETIYRWLPFRYIADVPYRFWLGSLGLEGLPASLLAQLVWLTLMTLIGLAYVNGNLRRVSLAGG